MCGWNMWGGAGECDSAETVYQTCSIAPEVSDKYEYQWSDRCPCPHGSAFSLPLRGGLESLSSGELAIAADVNEGNLR